MKSSLRLLAGCSLILVVGGIVLGSNRTHSQVGPNHSSDAQAQAQSPATPKEYALRPLPSSMLHRRQQAAAPHIRNRNGTSQNWGGYAVETSLTSPQRNAVSAVTGQWTIPTLSASSSDNTYSAIWVGIDGYSNGTVEQIGTEQDWTPNGQENYVWFEMYPKSAYLLVGFPIAQGDLFGAGVRYVGNSYFQLTVTNVTQHVSYTIPRRYTKAMRAHRTSAEWIVEPPYSGGILPLADFGTVSFGNCLATLNGVTGPINNSTWQYDPITMETADGTIKASVSGLTSKGTGFSVTWHHE